MQPAYYRIDADETGHFAVRMFSGDDAPILREPRFEGYAMNSVLHEAQGELSLLAKGDSARARVWLILDKYGVDPVYPEAVHHEVSQLLSNPGLDDPQLDDMTGHAFITIDNEDSRDLDQAMYIEPSGNGFCVYYALADAAHYVPPGSALFADALNRGASYYLPEMSVPMLPAALSEDLISLNPQVERRALVFIIKLDAEAEVQDSRIERARILSRAKLSYNGVQDFHDNPNGHALDGQDFTQTLQLLRTVGEKRIGLARLRNVVEYDRMSLDVSYASERGDRFVIREDQRLPVESWNEQISLLCNHQGASMLLDAQAQFNILPIFRVHDAPEQERLKKFSMLLNELTKQHGLPREKWIWRWRDGRYGNQESIAEYLRRLPDDGRTHAIKRAITHQAQMLNTASLFTAAPGPHHSLKLDGYARFSSPMREIAGVFTHREILEYCNCESVSQSVIDEDLNLREQVIDAANNARSLQKKLTKAVYKLAIDDLLNDDLAVPESERPVRKGVVFGVRPTRLYVRLEDPAIDVKVYSDHLQDLHGGQFQSDRINTSLYNRENDTRFVVGQTVSLRTEEYDESRGRWVLLPV